MADDTANPYYDPEKLDLRIVATLDDDEANYSYEMVVAWQHTDGTIYWAEDSGCSCPTPFEEFRRLELLQRAAPDLRDLQDAVNAHHHHTAADAERFMAACRKAQREGVQT